MKNQPNKVQSNFPGMDAGNESSMPGIKSPSLDAPHMKMQNHSHLAQVKGNIQAGYVPATKVPNSKVKGMWGLKAKP